MGERRTYIIDRRFQYAFIAKSVFLMLVAYCMLFIAIGLWQNYEFNRGFLLKLPPSAELRLFAQLHQIPPESTAYSQLLFTKAQLYSFYDILWKPLVVVMFINIIVLVIVNVFYSNRIAGPLYRLKKTLRLKINGQEVPPVYIRKNDNFQELADLINQVLEKQRNNP